MPAGGYLGCRRWARFLAAFWLERVEIRTINRINSTKTAIQNRNQRIFGDPPITATRIPSTLCRTLATLEENSWEIRSVRDKGMGFTGVIS